MLKKVKKHTTFRRSQTPLSNKKNIQYECSINTWKPIYSSLQQKVTYRYMLQVKQRV